MPTQSSNPLMDLLAPFLAMGNYDANHSHGRDHGEWDGQSWLSKIFGGMGDNEGSEGAPDNEGAEGEAMTTPAESMLQALQYGPTGYTDAMRANLGMDVPNAGFQGGQRQVSEMMKYPSPTGYQPVAPTYDPLAPALERGPKTPATVKDLYIGYNGAAPGGKSEKDNDPSSWFKDLFGGFMGDRTSHGGN